MDDREDRWHRWASDARTGDRDAYNRLLLDVSDRVRRFARSRFSRAGFSLDEVEDVVQDVLVAVHTKRDTWDPGRPIAPWIDAIIRYKTLDALRRIGRRAVGTDDIDAVAQDLATGAAGDNPWSARDLDRHLGTLPGREQGVVAALGLEGVSAAKCAERLGITEIDVRVAFQLGITRLRRLVSQEPTMARGSGEPRR